mgnify:FL=1|jgi:chaperonin GroES|tara:strand:- start:308 stop:628 length:321 start_codon:yes stop_codon:yes gene_type:complete
MKKLEALFDAVIVKPVEEEDTTYGSIVVPDMGKEKNQHAVVVAIGPGKRTINGNLIPTTAEVGQTVIVPTMGFTRMEFEGEEYYVGPENQLLARITDEDYQQKLPF